MWTDTLLLGAASQSVVVTMQSRPPSALPDGPTAGAPMPIVGFAVPSADRGASKATPPARPRTSGVALPSAEYFAHSITQPSSVPRHGNELLHRSRRLSHDEKPSTGRTFLIDVDETIRLVLEQEDRDGDYKVCITDIGPKVFALGTATSNGTKSFDLRGHWQISVLLQELALAHDHGRKRIVLHEARLTENPVHRLSRMIKTAFWSGLTRRIDADGLELICDDPKNRASNQAPRIYVPEAEPEMLQYYRDAAAARPHLKLDVCVLPRSFDAAFTKSLNDKPGLLALAMDKVKRPDGSIDFQGIPFIVPGARFNELDSYFISLGLLTDGRVDIVRHRALTPLTSQAKGIVEHFIFEIKHYGKILNGNRSYYLMRSQPPFLTDLALQVFQRLDPSTPEENKAWLRRAISAAIREYHTVWYSEPRLDPVSGLVRYRPDGLGIPPETEASHFLHILQPFAEKHGLSVNDFSQRYNDGLVSEPELDEYFLHDRAVRESGHDTTYRFERKCAHLGTVDLTMLLFKYAIDIAQAIDQVFGGTLELEDDFALAQFPFGTEVLLDPNVSYPVDLAVTAQPRRSTDRPVTAGEFYARAMRTQQLANHYLWNEGQGMYYDYDTVAKRNPPYESVTCLYALWSGCASSAQADKLVARSLGKFEVAGGLVPGTEESRGPISLDRPNRQWDYPTAWAPHQMLAWVGLDRYGFREHAERLAYRWCLMICQAFVDYNGTVPEKLDAVALSHVVTAEYGNQGTSFKLVPREGFGWTNASFVVGLNYLSSSKARSLAMLTPADVVYRPTA